MLTVTGLAEAGSGAPLQLDVATIDRVGLQSFSVDEPFVHQEMSFQGVDLGDLLRVIGVADEAGELHLVALDDYIVDLDVAEVLTGGTMLATHTGDGSAIPIEEGGPTRIVFTDGVAAERTENDWIWSLATVEVS